MSRRSDCRPTRAAAAREEACRPRLCARRGRKTLLPARQRPLPPLTPHEHCRQRCQPLELATTSGGRLGDQSQDRYQAVPQLAPAMDPCTPIRAPAGGAWTHAPAAPCGCVDSRSYFRLSHSHASISLDTGSATAQRPRQLLMLSAPTIRTAPPCLKSDADDEQYEECKVDDRGSHVRSRPLATNVVKVFCTVESTTKKLGTLATLRHILNTLCNSSEAKRARPSHSLATSCLLLALPLTSISFA